MAEPTRKKLLATLAMREALPIVDELDYYTADADTYRRAIDTLDQHGWMPWDKIERETLSSGTFETFKVAGIEFTSPRGVTPCTDPRRPMPIEKLDGPITIIVDGHRAEIEGPIAEGLRAAVWHAAGRPLPSQAEPHDTNVVQLGRHGRGRLVTAGDEAS